MDNPNKSERDYGIDLMRILMTLFVISLHVLVWGGIYTACFSDSIAYKSGIVLELEYAVSCAVNGFAVISGYVGCRSRFRFSRIIWLYLVVSFYNTVIPLLFHQFGSYTIDRAVILRAILPFAYNANWYFTAYLGLFFFMPFINLGVKQLDKKQSITAVSAILILFSLIPTLLRILFPDNYEHNPFEINEGFSAMWLAVLYVVGAVIREHDLFAKTPRIIGLLVYIISMITGSAISAIGSICSQSTMKAYYSPLIVVQAVSLLVFFRGLKLPRPVCKVISFLAPHSFNIYIIHTQDAIWTLLLYNRYYDRVQGYNAPELLIMFIFFTLSMYGACLAADMPLFYAIKLCRSFIGRHFSHKSESS